MGIEENKEVVLHYWELLNQRKPEAANDLFSSDFNMGGYSREDNKQNDINVLNAFPDVKWTISDMIAEGDTVAFVDSVAGTHTGGPFMGIPATGKKIDIKNTHIFRIIDKKIIEIMGTVDLYHCLQQLGVMPAIPEAVKAYNDSLE